MQALQNYETELKKAFSKIEQDLERHKGVFKRLESELEAVKEFESPNYTEALQAEIERDSALYRAIRDYYEQELFPENGDSINQHCQGVRAAINAVYNLGFAQGYTKGAQDAQQKAEKAERR